MWKTIGKLLSLYVSAVRSSTPYSTTASQSPAIPNFESNFDNVELQVQDTTGNWRTMHVTRNIPPMILSGMEQIADQFPGQRVRAVSNGRIVDIL